MNEPKISVIIPLYNAERYIRQCLISVLSSKFTDYEVVVVDDCSTDNSVAEVEKLLPHFGGRLKIFSTEKNSGGAGIPRDIGIKNSSGKYVTFLDNDDMILPTALGDFYDAAEEFQADVVCTEKYFLFDDADNFSGKNLKIHLSCPVEDLVSDPTPATDNLRARIQKTMDSDFFVLPWGRIYRRRFLLDNEIFFPQMRYGEDGNFGFKCFCLAEKYIHIPQITNLCRARWNSASRASFETHEGVRVWLDIITRNISDLAKFVDTLEVCQQDLEFRRRVLAAFIDRHFTLMQQFFSKSSKHRAMKIFFDELQNPALNQHGKNIITAHFFAEQALTR